MERPFDRRLPQFLRDMLAAPPSRGQGLHNWTFRAALYLHPYLPPEQILSLLEAILAGSGVRPGEIRNAINDSACVARRGKGCSLPRPQPRWPLKNSALRAAIASERSGLAALKSASLEALDAHTPGTEEFVDRLFPGNPLLCCGQDARHFDTKPREEWRGQLAGLQFIVPSPMSALRGKTLQGRTSARSISNTGDRRFIVVEFDAGSQDEQAAILLHLATKAPLAMAVHSGGKSIHGWFYCEGVEERDVRRFFSYAVSLGADRATYLRCQMVRMPGGRRDNGNRQQALFFNPKVIR